MEANDGPERFAASLTNAQRLSRRGRVVGGMGFAHSIQIERRKLGSRAELSAKRK